jgi:endonuclease/exonuclease/phosphatase family metal-dependent hydrolase
MVVATYNLWGWGEPWTYTAERGESRGAVPGSLAATLRLPEGLWPRRRKLIARALQVVQPDLVGLQEVACDPTAGISQAEQLAHDLGLACAYEPAAGLAVLSRCPIRRWEALSLRSGGSDSQAALRAEIEHLEGDLELRVVHLTTRGDGPSFAASPRKEAAQLAAVEALLASLDALPAGRAVIGLGDFNNEPDSVTLRAMTRGTGKRALRDAWRAANPTDPGLTMPSQAPAVRLDYLLVSPHLAVEHALRFGQEPDADGFYPSDHLGVAATLRFAPNER